MSVFNLYPTINPTLSFDFVNARALDPSITFTRNTSATYFDETGILRVAGANVPRLDYNPATLAAQGFLIEEARTNLVLQSEDFATTWTANSSPTITTNTTVAPNGTTTADTVTSTVTSSYVAQVVTFTGDGTKTFSIFIKAGTSSSSVIFIRDTTASVSRGTATITWSGGVPSVAVLNGSLQYLQACPNGWYRLAIIVDSVVAANSNQFRIQPDSLVGTGSLIVWGAQIENAAFSTSYIPTTTTALTRTADVASVNTLSPWYRADEGTLFAEYQPGVTAQNLGTAAFSDGTLNNRMIIRGMTTSSTTSFIGVNGGVTQWNDGFLTATATVTKSSFGYKLNDIAFTRNGITPITDTVATIPTVNQLVLGADGDQNVKLNGYLRRVTYYPVRLANAQLQAITA